MKKNSILATLGSIIEYFDFAIFGLLSIFIGENFFDSSNSISNEIKGLSVYIVGFFARPIGGIFFGILGDIKGRKKIFLILTLMMSISTFLIGILPSYKKIGIWSSILVTILRFLQGTSFAAELSGASLLIGESENAKKRFFGFSFLTSSTCIGAVFATGFVTVLYKVFSKEEICSWAFRIPFIFVGLFGLLLFFFRYRLSETKEFLLIDKIDNFSKILKEILKQKKKIFFSISSIIFISNLITANIFFPQILSLCFKFEVSKIYEYTTYSLIFSVFAGPFFCHIFSYFQKRKLMIYTLTIYLISALPSFYFLKNKNDFYLLFFLILQQIFISILYTCQISLIFETFPCNIRYTCKTLCNSISSFFSSFLPIIFNILKSRNKEYYIIYILIFLCFFSIKANYFLNKSKNEKFY